MKKVAIVTPEALSPNSFLWDEEAKRFKVRTNNLGENPITQQEDGLCVLGDGSEVVEPTNELGRYVFTNGVVELPHLRLEIVNNALVLTPKVNIPILTLQFLENGVPSTSHSYNVSVGQPSELGYITSCRIAYEYAESVAVMDVFLVRIEGPTEYGFVDILINARTVDFPST